jgi:hypothetical protein
MIGILKLLENGDLQRTFSFGIEEVTQGSKRTEYEVASRYVLAKYYSCDHIIENVLGRVLST